MAIKVKAIERNVSFQEGVEKWAFVLQTDLYNKLSASKVIQEASLRSGIPKGIIDGSVRSAVGELLAFAVVAQIPDIVQMVRNGKSIKLQKGDFSAEIGASE